MLLNELRLSRTIARGALVGTAVMVTLFAVAAPAAAQAGSNSDTDTQVVLTGRAEYGPESEPTML